MIPPRAVFEATGDALSATIGEMFDIPEQNIVEQLEEASTIDADSCETGKIDTVTEEPWNPLAVIFD